MWTHALVTTRRFLVCIPIVFPSQIIDFWNKIDSTRKVGIARFNFRELFRNGTWVKQTFSLVAPGTRHKATKILPCSDTMAQQDAQIHANRNGQYHTYRNSHTHLHINSLPVKLSDETRQGKGGGLCKANQTLAPAALCISSTSTPRPAFTIVINIIITFISIIIITKDTYGRRCNCQLVKETFQSL